MGIMSLHKILDMILLTTGNSVLHSPPGVPNYKWCQLVMGRELVLDEKGNIEERPQYIGTYNFDLGTNHGYQDVVPWLLWGNAPDDTTTGPERMKWLVVDGLAALRKEKQQYEYRLWLQNHSTLTLPPYSDRRSYYQYRFPTNPKGSRR